MLPWAAVAFSIVWGTVIGLAVTRGDPELAAFAGVGMLFTLVLTFSSTGSGSSSANWPKRTR